MTADPDGKWYAKDEADAVIRELTRQRDNAQQFLDECSVSVAELSEQVAELEAELNNRVEESAHWHGIAKQAEADRDALRLVLDSGHMRRVLRNVTNHAGYGINGALQDSVEWIEKQCQLLGTKPTSK
jgi:hypothetical protein